MCYINHVTVKVAHVPLHVFDSYKVEDMKCFQLIWHDVFMHTGWMNSLYEYILYGHVEYSCTNKKRGSISKKSCMKSFQLNLLIC